MFSVVALNTIVGNAQIPTRTPDWVNIKDPKFGAIGNGSHDDTAAIQAAIDYAFAHNRPAVYCPAGTYKTSSPITSIRQGTSGQIRRTRRFSVSRWRSSAIQLEEAKRT